MQLLSAVFLHGKGILNDAKYGLFIVFHILSKHYIYGYYGQVYVGKYFSFFTALLHVKVLS